jgi:hypothetical protein
MEKRGMSGIVITLVIILLSLVAIGILWVVVSAILKSNSKDISNSIGSFTTELEITAAYEQSGNIVVSIMRRAGDSDIAEMMFLFSDGIDTEDITMEVPGNFGKLSSKTFTVVPVEFSAADIATVSIVPLYDNGNENVPGEVADIANVNHGSVGGGDPIIPGCTPICTGLDCGADDGCGGLCDQETCGENATCESGVCVAAEEPCVPEDAATTCGTWVCGSRLNNCENLVVCGDLNGSCAQGEICDASAGVCNTITALNMGTVLDVWPGTSGLYLGSPNLPIDEENQTNLLNRYMKFSDSNELRCLQIVIYRLPVEGYNYSHIGFNFETDVLSGDQYAIYSSSTECNLV